MRTLLMIGFLAFTACGQAEVSSSVVTVAGTQPAETQPAETQPIDPEPLESIQPTTTETQPVASTSLPDVTDGCAHVVNATAVNQGAGTFTISATVLSADTGWDKYADLWTVSVDGVVIGERVLAHPHETEQPFTRSVSGVVVPEGATVLSIAAQDSVSGFCGEVFELEL